MWLKVIILEVIYMEKNYYSLGFFRLLFFCYEFYFENYQFYFMVSYCYFYIIQKSFKVQEMKINIILIYGDMVDNDFDVVFFFYSFKFGLGNIIIIFLNF